MLWEESIIEYQKYKLRKKRRSRKENAKWRTLQQGPHIVVIGGGTGLSVLLRGLKEYSSNITAIVSVGDDGGSSGRIREEFGMVPVGDVRNCIVALSDREDLMEQLFDYRLSEATAWMVIAWQSSFGGDGLSYWQFS